MLNHRDRLSLDISASNERNFALLFPRCGKEKCFAYNTWKIRFIKKMEMILCDCQLRLILSPEQVWKRLRAQADENTLLNPRAAMNHSHSFLSFS